MEKEITLKEFKEAKARLREEIEQTIQKGILDFYEMTGVRAEGNVYFNWLDEDTCDVYDGSVIRTQEIEILLTLKTDLEQ